MPLKKKYDSLDPITEVPIHCTECGAECKVIAFKGDQVCGIICYKKKNPEPPKPRY